MKQENNREGLVLLNHISKEIGFTVKSLKNMCVEKGIELHFEKIGNSGLKEHTFISIEDVKKLTKNNICPVCGDEFTMKKARQKYCSKKCQTSKNRKDFRSGKTDKKRGVSINSGKKIMKDIYNCSTKCLLDEFGDLE